MKSERRHELQHNELAEWLAKSALAIKPYQNLISAVVVLVMIGVVAYTVWSRISATQTAQAWDEMSAAMNGANPEKLAQVIDDYPHTEVAHMAALVLADNYLGDGCNQLFVNKIKGQSQLKKAIELYQTVREESRMPSLLERTTFGLARAKESQGDAEHIRQAEQLYEDVATKWPNGAFAVAATERLKDLKRPATKKLYDEFAHFDPLPPVSPKGGEPPAFDMNSLPNEPSAYMPETTHDVKLGKSKPGLPPLKVEPGVSKEKGREERGEGRGQKNEKAAGKK